MRKAVIFSDGASSGNPGPSGIGAVIRLQEKTYEISEHIGNTTNNAAEYIALISALRKALDLRSDEIEVYLDSELIVRQVNGTYRVKNERLVPLHEEVMFLLNKFKCYTIHHIPRSKNRKADELAKKASAQMTS